MLFQFDIIGMEWILGVGIMFGLAFVLNAITFNEVDSFFAWLMIFCGCVVWGGLLPLWTLILCIIVFTTILFFEMKDKGNGGDG